MFKKLHADIEIQGAAERVWHILTNFPGFPQWNPFIPHAEGEIKTGARLKVRIQPPGSGGMTFRPIVLKAEPDRLLCWKGHLYLPGLFEGEHSFIIDPLGEKLVRFEQTEIFTGVLVPLFAHTLETDTLRGFEEMNHALKIRVEQGG